MKLISKQSLGITILLLISNILFSQNTSTTDPLMYLKNKEIIKVVNASARENKINFKNQDHEVFGIY